MSWEQRGPDGPQDEIRRQDQVGDLPPELGRPAGDLPVIAPGQALTPASSNRPAVPAVVGPTGGGDRTLVGVFGDVRRSGRWHVPAQTTIVPVFGDAVLDLREAEFESSTVEVRVFGAFGDVKLIVPPGMDVQVRGFILFGDQKVDRRAPLEPGAPTVVVTAYGAFGDIKVKTLAIGEPEPTLWQRLRRER